jgi:photosystem II stability/assembly factor-like uncharacterized protein
MLARSFSWSLALLVLLPAIGAAQSFRKIAPVPTGANLTGVWFLSPDEGWIAGGAGVLLKTTDGGATWTPRTLPGAEGQPLYDVAFANSLVGFVSGNSAAYTTTDGGVTWTQVSNWVGGSWYHIQFVSQTVGFMGANGALVRTTDGGTTWPVRSAYPDCPIIYGMNFLDANTGLVSGSQASSGFHGIFKTTDGGLTWRLTHSGNDNDAIYLTNTVALADDGTAILRSTDGGDTWSQVATVSTGLSDLEKLDATTVIGVSTTGEVWRSDDGGVTWSERWTAGGGPPAKWAVRFSDPLNGHVVGAGGAILATSDGGVTWTRVNRGISVDWNGIVAFSDSAVVLAGLYGYVQTTADAGAHWLPQALDPPTFGRDTAFADISVAGATTAFAVGHWGGLFKTTDQGATWTNLSAALNPSYYPNAIAFTDESNGWIAGFDYDTGPKNYIRRTHDGGITWQTAALNVPAIDLDLIGRTGYVLTTSEPLYKTTDGGSSWIALTMSTPTGSPTSNMHMSWASADVGYVAGFDGYLAKTTDGGATWTRVRGEQSGFVYLDVKTAGPNEVWACAANSGGGAALVISSSDGGATWTETSLAGPFTTPYRIALTSSYAYVTGYNGDTWRFDRGPSYLVQATPSSQTVTAGSATTYVVSLTGTGGFGGPVALSVTGQPAGVTAAFDSPSITVDQTSTLAVQTSTMAAAGTYTLAIVGTADGVVHTTTVTLVVNPATPLPDLVESAVSNPPSLALAGGTFRLDDTVTNQGTAATTVKSVTGFYLSSDATKDAGDIPMKGARTISALAAGASSTGTTKLTVPAGTPPGAYFLIGCADDRQAIAESNEANNCRASATKIMINP